MDAVESLVHATASHRFMRRASRDPLHDDSWQNAIDGQIARACAEGLRLLPTNPGEMWP